MRSQELPISKGIADKEYKDVISLINTNKPLINHYKGIDKMATLEGNGVEVLVEATLILTEEELDALVYIFKYLEDMDIRLMVREKRNNSEIDKHATGLYTFINAIQNKGPVIQMRAKQARKAIADAGVKTNTVKAVAQEVTEEKQTRSVEL